MAHFADPELISTETLSSELYGEPGVRPSTYKPLLLLGFVCVDVGWIEALGTGSGFFKSLGWRSFAEVSFCLSLKVNPIRHSDLPDQVLVSPVPGTLDSMTPLSYSCKIQKKDSAPLKI